MKIRNLIYILLVSIGFSCNDGFLDKSPNDKLSDVSFWSNASDAVKYTTGVYRYLIAPVDDVMLTDSYTDNAVPVHIHDPQGAISSGSATSTNRFMRIAWEQAYQGIRRCEVFFENIDRVEMDAALKERLTGEVEFLRAFFYATLVQRFGGVSILQGALELNEAIPPRETEENTYKFIIAELDKAAAKLPVSYSSPDEIGRATRGAALSLKAILHLYYGNYEASAQSAKEVMDLGVYELFNDYVQLFRPEHKNNSEVIFDKQHIKEQYVITIDQAYMPVMNGGWTVMSPTQDLVDSYQCTDGKSIQDSPLYSSSNPYENRDPRLFQSIMWNGRVFAGKTYNTYEGPDKIGSGNATRTGYCLHKYLDPAIDGNTQRSWTNFIYIRYAEILLTYAEAKTRASGPDQSVYDAVNKVRQRPTVEMPPLPEGLSREEMLDAIILERRVELTFEGKRLFDIRRLRIAEEVMTKPVYGQVMDGEHVFIEQRSFNPQKDYLWAIPLSEIDLSNGALVQNPGY